MYLSQLLDTSLVRHFGVLVSLNAALEAGIGEASGGAPGFARTHLHSFVFSLHVTRLEHGRLEVLTVREPQLWRLDEKKRSSLLNGSCCHIHVFAVKSLP